MNIRMIAALGAASVALATVPAAAQETRTEIVSYGDLDLSQTAGMEELERRLHRAIRRVCRQTGTHSLFGRAATRECRRGLRVEVRQLMAGLSRGSVRLAGKVSVRSDS